MPTFWTGMYSLWGVGGRVAPPPPSVCQKTINMLSGKFLMYWVGVQQDHVVNFVFTPIQYI